MKQERVPKAVCVSGQDGRIPQQCVAETHSLPIVKHRRMVCAS